MKKLRTSLPVYAISFLFSLACTSTLKPMDIDIAMLWQKISTRIWGPPILTPPASNEQESSDENTCVICLENLNSQPTIAVCDDSHIFHKKCLSQWVVEHATCPLDRNELTQEMLMDKLSPLQVKALDALTFSEGILDGIRGYLFYRQVLTSSLSLWAISALSAFVINRLDNYWYPQHAHLGPSSSARLRRTAATTILTGFIATQCGRRNSFLLRTIRPIMRQSIHSGGRLLFERASPGFDYRLAQKLDKRSTMPYCLTAGGIVLGVIIGKYLENKLEQLVTI